MIPTPPRSARSVTPTLPRSVQETEKDDPSIWSVILVTVALAVLCFGFVVTSEKYHEHIHKNPNEQGSFNLTLTKDVAEDRAHSERIRISLSYATAILGFIVGTCLGMVIGLLCCTRIIGGESGSEHVSERTEKSPLISRSKDDKMRVV